MKLTAIGLAVVFAAALVGQVEPSPNSKKVAEDLASRQDEDDEPLVDPASGAAAIAAGLGAIGVGSDNLSPGAESALEVITTSGELVSQLLPPPYGVIASIGFTTLGSLFGGGAGVSNGKILKAIESGFAKIFAQLNRIEIAIAEVSAAIDDLSRVTRFNSQVVQQIYHEIWVEPFQRIHAAYSSLMETYYPTSDSRSWDNFFEKANVLRGELEAEVFDSFTVSNLRDYLQWYELDVNIDPNDKINNMGKCGVTLLFQYLMTVRSELFLISSFGSYERLDGDSCDRDMEICWELNDDLIQAYTNKYKEQLVEYDFMILNAEERGGLGIAHLVPKSPAGLLQGVQGGELGFCFQCDSSGTNGCKDYTPYPWPTTSNRAEDESVNDVYSYQTCNAKTFEKTWYYYGKVCKEWDEVQPPFEAPCTLRFGGQPDSRGKCRYECPGRCPACSTTYPERNAVNENRQDLVEFATNVEGLGCCSCGCLSSDDYNDNIAGTQDDHKTYARHCGEKELEYSPFMTFPTSTALDTDFLEIDEYFRISRVDNEHLSISATTRHYQNRAKEDGALGSYFTQEDLITPIVFTSDGTSKRGKSNNHDYNGWTGWAHATKSAGGVVFGQYGVQIGDWRIRAFNDASQSHLSVTHKNGNVSRIYKCDGTEYGNIASFSGYTSDLGAPRCAFLTKRYLQLGNWRIGRWVNVQHLSVTHRNGMTGEYYKTDGIARNGKYNDGNIWKLNDPVLYGSNTGCSQLSTTDRYCF